MSNKRKNFFDVSEKNPYENKATFNESFSLAAQETRLNYLSNSVDKNSYQVLNTMFKKYPDYSKNKDSYEAYANLNHQSGVSRDRYDNAIDKGLYSLDDKQNVVSKYNNYMINTSSPYASVPNIQYLNESAIRGKLLANMHGFTSDKFNDNYKGFIDEQENLIAQQRAGKTQNKIGFVLGNLKASIIDDPWLTTEDLILGTITGGFGTLGKAGVLAKAGFDGFSQGIAGATTESLRQKSIAENMHFQNKNYTLWDETKEVMSTGIAQGLIGAVVPVAAKGIAKSIKFSGNAMQKVAKGIRNKKEFLNIKKDIPSDVNRAILEENNVQSQSRLNVNMDKHEFNISKSLDDLNDEKQVVIQDDVGNTEIPYDPTNDKDNPFNDVNIFDEADKQFVEKGYLDDEIALGNDIEKNKNVDDFYDKLSDDEINDMINTYGDPEDLEDIQDISDISNVVNGMNQEELDNLNSSLATTSTTLERLNDIPNLKDDLQTSLNKIVKNINKHKIENLTDKQANDIITKAEKEIDDLSNKKSVNEAGNIIEEVLNGNR